ncbi:hypothetical protein D3C87_2007160 [compost metagenome]
MAAGEAEATGDGAGAGAVPVQAATASIAATARVEGKNFMGYSSGKRLMQLYCISSWL